MRAILARFTDLQGGGSIRGDQQFREGSRWLQNQSFGDRSRGPGNLPPPISDLTAPNPPPWTRVYNADFVILIPQLCVCVCVCHPQPNQSRTIWHYQYMSWPDHGVPHEPGAVLSFLSQVNGKQADYPDAGPMVIHCRCSPCCDTFCQKENHSNHHFLKAGKVFFVNNEVIFKTFVNYFFSSDWLTECKQLIWLFCKT